jgi:hypothetical protein
MWRERKRFNWFAGRSAAIGSRRGPTALRNRQGATANPVLPKAQKRERPAEASLA